MTIKTRTTIESALIIVLGLYSALLSTGIKFSKHEAEAARARIIADQIRTVPEESGPQTIPPLGGIDISGNLLHPMLVPNTKSLAIFLMRGQSIQGDLNFWKGVEFLLPKKYETRLVGYCDGTLCTEAIKRELQQVTFPVIAYAGASGSQSLLDADENGYFLLVTRNSYGWFRWRTRGQTARELITKVFKP